MLVRQNQDQITNLTADKFAEITLKHLDGSIIVWGCLFCHEDRLIRITRIMIHHIQLPQFPTDIANKKLLSEGDHYCI